MADDRGLDLVLVSMDKDPQIAKFMDYGKMIFERNKKQKEARKNSKVTEMKEFRLTSNIAEHDMAFKAKNVREFFEKGTKVKIVIKIKGRSMSRPEMIKEVLYNFANKLEDVAEILKAPQITGKTAFMILNKKK